MDAAAQLITAIAALVTAIGTASAAIILAVRSSSRQRVAAAQEASRLTDRHNDGKEAAHDSHRHRAGPAAGNPDWYRDDQRKRDAIVEDAEIALGARELARDAADLAREANRDARFNRIEHELEHPDPDGGGPVA